MTHIAVLGAGHTGPIIARVAVEAGYQVSISASGDPDRIRLITQILAPGAKPHWAADAVRDADLVIMAIPLHAFARIDPAPLAGKVVVDMMNYWAPIDGVQPLFDGIDRGSSEIVAERLAGSTVVKTLNHIGYHDLDDRRRPPGSPERLALGVAGDDPAAVDAVAEFIDNVGYDPIRFGSLSAGRFFQPGSLVFGALLTRPEFESALNTAPRAA
jgi:predicted dinucleotide-binding enzyme